MLYHNPDSKINLPLKALSLPHPPPRVIPPLKGEGYSVSGCIANQLDSISPDGALVAYRAIDGSWELITRDPTLCTRISTAPHSYLVCQNNYSGLLITGSQITPWILTQIGATFGSPLIASAVPGRSPIALSDGGYILQEGGSLTRLSVSADSSRIWRENKVLLSSSPDDLFESPSSHTVFFRQGRELRATNELSMAPNPSNKFFTTSSVTLSNFETPGALSHLAITPSRDFIHAVYASRETDYVTRLTLASWEAGYRPEITSIDLPISSGLSYAISPSADRIAVIGELICGSESFYTLHLLHVPDLHSQGTMTFESPMSEEAQVFFDPSGSSVVIISARNSLALAINQESNNLETIGIRRDRSNTVRCLASSSPVIFVNDLSSSRVEWIDLY